MRHVRHLMFLTVTCGCLSAAPASQDPASPPPPPTNPPASGQDVGQEKQEKQKTLDELLGLDKDEQQSRAADVAERQQEEELERRLLQQQINESLAAAIDGMSLSAELLDEDFDPGLGTQRVQEEILEKLDVLIEAANQQSNKQSNSSSSRSQQSQRQQQPGHQQRQQQQQQNSGNDRNDQPSNSREGDPPPRAEGAINTIIDETRSEWGNLPPRIREMLLQGSRDEYSSLYERLTAEYYRRLAENATGGN